MMRQQLFNVVYLREASDFLQTLQPQARSKIYYNILKVAGGIKDSELFKKLEGHNDLWEFRTLFNGIQYRLLAFWDAEANGSCDTWLCQENMESTDQRNSQSRSPQKEIL